MQSKRFTCWRCKRFLQRKRFMGFSIFRLFDRFRIVSKILARNRAIFFPMIIRIRIQIRSRKSHEFTNKSHDKNDDQDDDHIPHSHHEFMMREIFKLSPRLTETHRDSQRDSRRPLQNVQQVLHRGRLELLVRKFQEGILRIKLVQSLWRKRRGILDDRHVSDAGRQRVRSLGDWPLPNTIDESDPIIRDGLGHFISCN